jgi:hypothetical protein
LDGASIVYLDTAGLFIDLENLDVRFPLAFCQDVKLFGFWPLARLTRGRRRFHQNALVAKDRGYSRQRNLQDLRLIRFG